jgi:hypothetical protein
MAKGVDKKAGGCDGWARWLLARWNGRRREGDALDQRQTRLHAPRQSLALIEAEGRRILVATSAEGGPAFYPLDEPANSRAYAGANGALHGRSRTSRGVSW